MNDTVYTLQRGTTPLLVSLPHCGTHIPPDIAEALLPRALHSEDTDWFLDRLYAFATELGAGLIAPRPLLLEMGIYDDCFYIHDLLEGHAGVKRIYQAAQAEDKLWADVFAGPHAFAGNKAMAFFKTYL